MSWTKYFCTEVTPELKKRAEDELGETDEVKSKCLAKIKNLIKDEADFNPCMDDLFLLRFLRVRKFDTERAFKSLKDYYEYKAQYSGIISDILPSNIKHVFEYGESTILEHRNTDGAGVFIIRTGHYDPREVKSEEQIALALMATEVGLETEATQITGYSVIVDFHDYTLAKAKHYGNPKAVYRAFITVLKSIPCRIKSYHIVNEPSFVHGLLNVAMHLVSTKLQQRLHFHGSDFENLHEFISPEILPEEYGGKQGPLKNYARLFGEMVLNREEYFKKMKKYGYSSKTVEALKK